MGYLNKKSCYLIGPIAQDAKDGILWRDEITPGLNEFGVFVRDPCKKTGVLGEVGDDKYKFRQMIKERKFMECKKAFYPVMKADLRMVDLSDFCIMEYLPKVATVGSIQELITARKEQKKPVLVHCAEKDLDDFNPWILALIKDNWLFTEWKDMFTYLKQIDTGNIDSSHWT